MSNKSLSSAEKILLELQSNYLVELPSRLDEIEGLILLLDKDPTLDDEFLDLLRSVHSLKGSAGTYSYHIISNICHHMEDSLKHVADDRGTLTSRYISIWLDYVDLIRQTVTLLRKKVERFSDIESRLQELDEAFHANDFRVLIVDPSRSAVQLYKMALDGLPLKCAVEADGIKALERLLVDRVDVLITSMEVPMLNGPVILATTRMAGVAGDVSSILVTSKEKLKFDKLQKPDYIIKRGATLVDKMREAVKEIIYKGA